MASAQDMQNYLAAATSLVCHATTGTLATVFGTTPHAAFVTTALLPDGAPLLLLSTLSQHTRHLQANPACALLIVGVPTTDNPQTAPRVTLAAHATPTTDAAARRNFLARHPYAEQYIGFADFAFWRLDLRDAHFIGGFAAAARLDIAALQQQIIALAGKLHG